MIGSILKIGLLLVVGILVYNFLFGTNEEKKQSQKAFQKTGSALSSAWGLLKSERQKFDAGKYDEALDQLGNAYGEVRDRAKYVDEKVLRRLDNLEQRKSDLEKELDGIKDPAPAEVNAPTTKKGIAKTPPTPDQSAKALEQQRKKEKLMKELDRLMDDTDQLLKEAQQ